MGKGEQKLEDYGGMLKKEEGDKIPQMNYKPRQQLMYANVSHISELNEEDSYQYDVRDKRQKQETDPNDLESLGEEEQF